MPPNFFQGCPCGHPGVPALPHRGHAHPRRPWLARVEVSTDPQAFKVCGGVVLNRLYLATAAGCVCRRVLDCARAKRGTEKRVGGLAGELQNVPLLMEI